MFLLTICINNKVATAVFQSTSSSKCEIKWEFSAGFLRYMRWANGSFYIARSVAGLRGRMAPEWEAVAAAGNWVMWRDWREDEVVSPSGSRWLKGDRSPCLSRVNAWQLEVILVFYVCKRKKAVRLGGLRLASGWRQETKQILVLSADGHC